MPANGSLYDWAARCAEKIDDEYPTNRQVARERPTQARIATIIEVFAKPLLQIVRDSRHIATHDVNCASVENEDDDECDCGVKEWLARIEEALK